MSLKIISFVGLDSGDVADSAITKASQDLKRMIYNDLLRLSITPHLLFSIAILVSTVA